MRKIKYDILNPFQDYLEQNLSRHTAKRYYSAAVKLLHNVQFNSVSEIKTDFLERELEKCKTKNEFSAAKNAVLHLNKLYPELKIPGQEFFRQTSMKKRNRSKKPKKVIMLDETQRKINQIRNPKLRYAYRLALVSGLRVSELAALEKKDISFDDRKIIVQVRNGKGGSNGKVECRADPYLYKKLLEYMEDMQPEDKLFYSEVYLREKADQLNIECHDLRRIFAITTRNELKKEMSVFEANSMVQKKLRHKRFSTTKRYLFNRKLIIKKKEDVNNERERTESNAGGFDSSID